MRSTPIGRSAPLTSRWESRGEGTLDEPEDVENVRVGGREALARLEFALVLLRFVDPRPALLEGSHSLLDVDGVVGRGVRSFRLRGRATWKKSDRFYPSRSTEDSS